MLLSNKVTASQDGLEVVGPMMGESMPVTDGADHRRMRGAVARTFTPKGLSAARAGQIMATKIQQRVASWEGAPKLKIVTLARDLTLDIIFAIVGVPEDSSAEWRRRYDDFLLGFINLPVRVAGSPQWRSRRARRWLDRRLEAIVGNAKAKKTSDLVSGMVHGRDSEGQGLSQQELIDNLRVLLFAGHETTATAIAWMTYHLAADPSLWRRLCREIGPASELPLSNADLAPFPFAMGLFREALRLHPPIGMVGRKVIKEVEIHGRRISPGTSVGICIADLSRDPKRYENPDQIRPERWSSTKVRAGSLETVQFGGGPHFCLGYHLALLEGVQFLVAFASSLQRRGVQLVRRPLPSGIQYPIARASGRARLSFEPVP